MKINKSPAIDGVPIDLRKNNLERPEGLAFKLQCISMMFSTTKRGQIACKPKAIKNRKLLKVGGQLLWVV